MLPHSARLYTVGQRRSGQGAEAETVSLRMGLWVGGASWERRNGTAGPC